MALLCRLWSVYGVEPFALVIDARGQWTQRVQVLARVVAAEQEFSTVLHYDTNIRGCAATIATICGRQWSGGRQGWRHLSTSYIR